MGEDKKKIRGEIFVMNNKKGEITTIKNFEFYWERCKRHWKSTWVNYKSLFENKTCVDIGMWKGILNAMAKKKLNCTTTVGVEPDELHRADCKKMNPSTKLYVSIEKLPDSIYTDVLVLHGVISLMGTHWVQEMKNLLSKVNCKNIHIRTSHGETFTNNNKPSGTNRETNRYNLNSYKNTPSPNSIIEFLNTKNFNLINQTSLTKTETIMIFERDNYEKN